MIPQGKRWSLFGCATVFSVLLIIIAAFASPATVLAASVSGELKVDGGKKLKNMIVFLEPADKKPPMRSRSTR